MLLPSGEKGQDEALISKRDQDNKSSQAAILVIVSLAITASSIILTYIILKFFRKRYSNPKYVPTKYLKRKWEDWNPIGFMPKGNYSSRLQENSSVPTLHLRSGGDRSARGSTYNIGDPERAQAAEAVEEGSGAGATVDRNTSVRSVMTLPAYSRSVRDNERVLGREGDRGGIDVVVEHPETVEEEEDRREDEMQSLYNIRVQRRQEIAAREARRQERRDARARGDTATLDRLRQESALRAQDRDLSGTAAMIAEHQSRSRDRRVSSVSYAELGVARHDGTRVRANSNESDRPLLDSAASIAGGSIHPASIRARSTSSMISVSDNGSDVEMPPYGRAGSDFEIVHMNQPRSPHRVSQTYTPASNRSRAPSGTVPPPVETSTDIGEAPIPEVEPPSYEGDGFEEAPPYTSPIQERAPQQLPNISEPPPPPPPPPPEERPQPQRITSETGAPMLPDIGRLPSIRIADATPISPNANVQWPSPERNNRKR